MEFPYFLFELNHFSYKEYTLEVTGESIEKTTIREPTCLVSAPLSLSLIISFGCRVRTGFTEPRLPMSLFDEFLKMANCANIGGFYRKAV